MFISPYNETRFAMIYIGRTRIMTKQKTTKRVPKYLATIQRSSERQSKLPQLRRALLFLQPLSQL